MFVNIRDVGEVACGPLDTWYNISLQFETFESSYPSGPTCSSLRAAHTPHSSRRCSSRYDRWCRATDRTTWNQLL